MVGAKQYVRNFNLFLFVNFCQLGEASIVKSIKGKMGTVQKENTGLTGLGWLKSGLIRYVSWMVLIHAFVFDAFKI